MKLATLLSLASVIAPTLAKTTCTFTGYDDTTGIDYEVDGETNTPESITCVVNEECTFVGKDGADFNIEVVRYNPGSQVGQVGEQDIEKQWNTSGEGYTFTPNCDQVGSLIEFRHKENKASKIQILVVAEPADSCRNDKIYTFTANNNGFEVKNGADVVTDFACSFNDECVFNVAGDDTIELQYADGAVFKTVTSAEAFSLKVDCALTEKLYYTNPAISKANFGVVSLESNPAQCGAGSVGDGFDYVVTGFANDEFQFEIDEDEIENNPTIVCPTNEVCSIVLKNDLPVGYKVVTRQGDIAQVSRNGAMNRAGQIISFTPSCESAQLLQYSTEQGAGVGEVIVDRDTCAGNEELVTKTFSVFNRQAAAYILNDQENPTVTCAVGERCVFQLGTTMAIHPFIISKVGERVFFKDSTTSVQINGATFDQTQGITQAGDRIEFIPTCDTPDELEYLCTAHPGAMIGKISVEKSAAECNPDAIGGANEDIVYTVTDQDNQVNYIINGEKDPEIVCQIGKKCIIKLAFDATNFPLQVQTVDESPFVGDDISDSNSPAGINKIDEEIVLTPSCETPKSLIYRCIDVVAMQGTITIESDESCNTGAASALHAPTAATVLMAAVVAAVNMA